MFMGERDFRPDGSYITTEFFILFLFPVAPLRSYRVIPLKGNEYAVVEKLPSYHSLQARSIQAMAIACILTPMLYVSSGMAQTMHRADEMLGLIWLALSATWPLLLGWVLRYMAKRRVQPRG
jgi:hypothetical protein